MPYWEDGQPVFDESQPPPTQGGFAMPTWLGGQTEAPPPPMAKPQANAASKGNGAWPTGMPDIRKYNPNASPETIERYKSAMIPWMMQQDMLKSQFPNKSVGGPGYMIGGIASALGDAVSAGRGWRTNYAGNIASRYHDLNDQNRNLQDKLKLHSATSFGSTLNSWADYERLKSEQARQMAQVQDLLGKMRGGSQPAQIAPQASAEPNNVMVPAPGGGYYSAPIGGGGTGQAPQAVQGATMPTASPSNQTAIRDTILSLDTIGATNPMAKSVADALRKRYDWEQEAYQKSPQYEGAKEFEKQRGKQAADTIKQEPKALGSLKSAFTRGTMMLEDIDRATEMANGWTTGAGSLFSYVPGTQARNLDAILDGIKANIGFKELQEMRANSPTGGALGSVTEKELRMLQSVLGSLEQSQSEDQFKYNLARLKTQVRQSYASIADAYEKDYGARPEGFEKLLERTTTPKSQDRTSLPTLSPEEARKAPPGTRFMSNDGRVMVTGPGQPTPERSERMPQSQWSQ